MSETTFRRRVVRELRCYDAYAMESITVTGYPDIVTTMGAIELKYKASWPKRASTPLRMDHFTPEQRAWHDKHWRRGGVSWVFSQVGRDYVLLRGDHAAKHLGNMTKAELWEIAHYWTSGNIDEYQLKKTLAQGFLHYHTVIPGLAPMWSSLDKKPLR